MVKGFWKKLAMSRRDLDRPILALAPMADVTDAAFRRIIAKYGKPDVMFTEFVSCDGLCSSGKKNLLPILKYTGKERPIVAQVFGAKPENFYESAKLIKKLGFDGIDINMGCPDKKVIKQGAGAALMQNHELAKKIIKETKKGAGNIPVSIKTRIGYNKYDKKEFKEWLTVLLECEPAAITIHARTKKEVSLVPAHWDIIAEAVKIRDKFFGDKKDKTLILGNGDVQSVADAKKKARISGADGVMIGRAVFGNPWLFLNAQKTNFKNPRRGRPTESASLPVGEAGLGLRDFQNLVFEAFKPTVKEKLSVLLEHAKLFEKINKGRKFDVMKKHFKSYVSGFSGLPAGQAGAKELRIRLMACKNAKDAEEITLFFLQSVYLKSF